MSFHLTPEQDLIRKTVREFAKAKVEPTATRADREEQFPREALASMKELGLLGMTLPPEEGGAGADNVSFVLACEEVFAKCASTGILFATTNCYLAEAIHTWGGPELKETWLPKIVSGAAVGTIGLWEDHCGGNVEAVRTRAIRSGEDYVLRGTKGLVLGLGVADAAIIFARVMEKETEFPSTAPGGGRLRYPVTAFLVPIGEGTHWGTSESKLGLRGAPTGELYLVRAKTRKSHRLGAEGEGGKVQRHLSDFLTLALAAGGLGIARAAHEASIAFARQRVQFGSPIAGFEGIQHYVAQMQTRLDAAASLTYAAAAARDAGEEFGPLAEEAALAALETAKWVTRHAHRIHAGAGFMRELPVERYSRDVRTLAVVGRTVDVLRTTIGARVLAAETLEEPAKAPRARGRLS